MQAVHIEQLAFGVVLVEDPRVDAGDGIALLSSVTVEAQAEVGLRLGAKQFLHAKGLEHVLDFCRA